MIGFVFAAFLACSRSLAKTVRALSVAPIVLGIILFFDDNYWFYQGFSNALSRVGMISLSNENLTFIGAGAGYSLISGQPCSPCAPNDGGWHAAEYSMPGITPDPSAVFTYDNSNFGWVELAMSFSPVTVSTSIVCGPMPFIVGTASTCTATEAGASPTGSVAWSSNATGTLSATTCTLSSGQCSVSYTPSGPSTSSITASYGGDSTNPATSGTFAVTAIKATPKVSASCTPSLLVPGSLTTCTATVTGASPAGTITWASSGVADFSPESTCTLSAGSCAVNYTPSTPVSPITITALYSGDANNAQGSGTFSLTIGVNSSSSMTTKTSTTSAPTTSSVSSTSTTSGSSSSEYIPQAVLPFLVSLATILGAYALARKKTTSKTR